MEITTSHVADHLLACVRDAGGSLGPSTRLLDFGCGSGDMVRVFLDRGLDAYGADVGEWWKEGDTWNLKPRWEGEDLKRFGLIQTNPYRMPFEDDFFDVVVSNQVFEHVMNYRDAFREIRRVMKPGGITLHLFPSRWKPIEGHTYVPFSSVFRPYWYLALWAKLGVRHELQAGKDWRATAKQNLEYLDTCTHYPTNDEVRRVAREVFGNIEFMSESYVRHHPGRVGSLARKLPLPGLPDLLSFLAQRVILMRK